MFLGTQVRESIDLLTKEGYGRDIDSNAGNSILYSS